jgi:hypothetical protein
MSRSNLGTCAAKAFISVVITNTATATVGTSSPYRLSYWVLMALQDQPQDNSILLLCQEHWNLITYLTVFFAKLKKRVYTSPPKKGCCATHLQKFPVLVKQKWCFLYVESDVIQPNDVVQQKWCYVVHTTIMMLYVHTTRMMLYVHTTKMMLYVHTTRRMLYILPECCRMYILVHITIMMLYVNIIRTILYVHTTRMMSYNQVMLYLQAVFLR